MKNKLFMIIIAMLIVITLILVAFFALWNFMEKSKSSDPHEAAKSSVESVQGKKVTAEEAKANTVIIKDILTNLSDKDRVIKTSFAFELDNKKAKTEFENLDFKMKGIINQTLADMTTEQVQGSKGQENLKAALMNKINAILVEGKLKQVWITDVIVQ